MLLKMTDQIIESEGVVDKHSFPPLSLVSFPLFFISRAAG